MFLVLSTESLHLVTRIARFDSIEQYMAGSDFKDYIDKPKQLFAAKLHSLKLEGQTNCRAKCKTERYISLIDWCRDIDSAQRSGRPVKTKREELQEVN